MLLNEFLLNGKSGSVIKLAYSLGELSNGFNSDIKLIKGDGLNFCFGVEKVSNFDADLLSAIKKYCKEKELKIKTKQTKRTTICQII